MSIKNTKSSEKYVFALLLLAEEEAAKPMKQQTNIAQIIVLFSLYYLFMRI